MLRVGLLLCAAALCAFGQQAGKAEYERHCALCHGMEGKGGRGPSLARALLPRAGDDEALKKLIQEGLEPEMPAFWFLTKEDVAKVAGYVRDLGKVPTAPVTGDARRGATLYTNSGCSSCHMLAGLGNGFGPELTDIGLKRSADHLAAALRKPASSLPEAFMLVEAKTADGRSVRGIRVNEDTFTIQIRDASGRYHSLQKSELGSFRKLRGQTPMPSYEGRLTPAEIDDLVAYLASLKGSL